MTTGFVAVGVGRNTSLEHRCGVLRVDTAFWRAATATVESLAPRHNGMLQLFVMYMVAAVIFCPLNYDAHTNFGLLLTFAVAAANQRLDDLDNTPRKAPDTSGDDTAGTSATGD